MKGFTRVGCSSWIVKNNSDHCQQRKDDDGVCSRTGVNPKFGGEKEGEVFQEHRIRHFKNIQSICGEWWEMRQKGRLVQWGKEKYVESYIKPKI